MQNKIKTKRSGSGNIYFDLVKSSIYAFPFNEGGLDLSADGCPYVQGYGTMWQFIVQDPAEPAYMKSVTNALMDEWEISKNTLLETAKDNIRRSLPYAVYQVLCGEVSASLKLPFMKIYLKGKSQPPFGASMLLLEEVGERICLLSGNFCAFVADMESLIVLPSNLVIQYRLDPVKCFEKIMRDTWERPTFAPEECLFPELMDKIPNQEAVHEG